MSKLLDSQFFRESGYHMAEKNRLHMFQGFKKYNFQLKYHKCYLGLANLNVLFYSDAVKKDPDYSRIITTGHPILNSYHCFWHLQTCEISMLIDLTQFYLRIFSESPNFSLNDFSKLISILD